MPLAGPVIASPLNTTRPLVGSSRPEISLSSVDLPQPDGPTIDRKLPFSMLQDRPSNTVSALPLMKNTLPRSYTSMIGRADAAPDTTVSFGLPALFIAPGSLLLALLLFRILGPANTLRIKLRVEPEQVPAREMGKQEGMRA